ncbi:MAG: transcription termination/antitermination protein NusG [Opitutia bacterium]|jgi:transcriptional antiterminator RfaH
MSEAGSPWFCVRCKPRQERVAAGQLASLEGLELLFPRARRRRAGRSGAREVVEPLFPGYLFASFDPAELASQVGHCRGVLQLVRKAGKAVDVEPKVIAELRALGDGGVIDAMDPLPLPGQKVKVLRGLFLGEEGEVVRLAEPSRRVKVLLQLLGADHVVELPADDVGPAPAER